MDQFWHHLYGLYKSQEEVMEEMYQEGRMFDSELHDLSKIYEEMYQQADRNMKGREEMLIACMRGYVEAYDIRSEAEDRLDRLDRKMNICEEEECT